MGNTTSTTFSDGVVVLPPITLALHSAQPSAKSTVITTLTYGAMGMTNDWDVPATAPIPQITYGPQTETNSVVGSSNSSSGAANNCRVITPVPSTPLVDPLLTSKGRHAVMYGIIQHYLRVTTALVQFLTNNKQIPDIGNFRQTDEYNAMRDYTTRYQWYVKEYGEMFTVHKPYLNPEQSHIYAAFVAFWENPFALTFLQKYRLYLPIRIPHLFEYWTDRGYLYHFQALMDPAPGRAPTRKQQEVQTQMDLDLEMTRPRRRSSIFRRSISLSAPPSTTNSPLGGTPSHNGNGNGGLSRSTSNNNIKAVQQQPGADLPMVDELENGEGETPCNPTIRAHRDAFGPLTRLTKWDELSVIWPTQGTGQISPLFTSNPFVREYIYDFKDKFHKSSKNSKHQYYNYQLERWEIPCAQEYYLRECPSGGPLRNMALRKDVINEFNVKYWIDFVNFDITNLFIPWSTEPHGPDYTAESLAYLLIDEFIDKYPKVLYNSDFPVVPQFVVFTGLEKYLTMAYAGEVSKELALASLDEEKRIEVEKLLEEIEFKKQQKQEQKEKEKIDDELPFSIPTIEQLQREQQQQQLNNNNNNDNIISNDNSLNNTPSLSNNNNNNNNNNNDEDEKDNNNINNTVKILDNGKRVNITQTPPATPTSTQKRPMAFGSQSPRNAFGRKAGGVRPPNHKSTSINNKQKQDFLIDEPTIPDLTDINLLSIKDVVDAYSKHIIKRMAYHLRVGLAKNKNFHDGLLPTLLSNVHFFILFNPYDIEECRQLFTQITQICAQYQYLKVGK